MVVQDGFEPSIAGLLDRCVRPLRHCTENRYVVDLARFELATSCLQSRRSSNWSYRPMDVGSRCRIRTSNLSIIDRALYPKVELSGHV
jgi:hypothetical protein